ncbi:hypothetical protein [Paenibacillus aquistagni]|uniref:hypothetical protein n=1 Tax=Paenibacillus aquistagni TaxID=1852522 RepID=UPI00145C0F1D|nr:hypothetical protein [Paenibacillus aquistagni]NMM54327.1 hypothetical protein [Paenibacillus aquistagni]
MNLKSKVLVVASALVCVTTVSIIASGVGAQPGDSQDPLVTKSYVDTQIKKLVQEEIGKQQGGTGSGGNNSGSGNSGSGSEGGSSADTAMEIVTIKPGQQLVAKAGAEFVIRAGKAAIYSSDANGVSDLTAGSDLANGTDAPTNHLLMFPREGRGIVAKDTVKNSVVVMVRGGYEIQKTNK